jgi:hypothetical protein
MRGTKFFLSGYRGQIRRDDGGGVDQAIRYGRNQCKPPFPSRDFH